MTFKDISFIDYKKQEQLLIIYLRRKQLRLLSQVKDNL